MITRPGPLRRPALAAAVATALAITLTGCVADRPGAPEPGWTVGPSAPVASLRDATVYRSPLCSCCHEYEAYLRAAGWTVATVDVDDTAAFKAGRGIPEAAWSCHTVIVEGYTVEGHVPLVAIERLLAERPAIDGIALPGMPAGSPGMPGVQEAPFVVLAIEDGSTSEFGAY